MSLLTDETKTQKPSAVTRLNAHVAGNARDTKPIRCRLEGTWEYCTVGTVLYIDAEPAQYRRSRRTEVPRREVSRPPPWLGRSPYYYEFCRSLPCRPSPEPGGGGFPRRIALRRPRVRNENRICPRCTEPLCALHVESFASRGFPPYIAGMGFRQQVRPTLPK